MTRLSWAGLDQLGNISQERWTLYWHLWYPHAYSAYVCWGGGCPWLVQSMSRGARAASVQLHWRTSSPRVVGWKSQCSLPWWRNRNPSVISLGKLLQAPVDLFPPTLSVYIYLTDGGPTSIALVLQSSQDRRSCWYYSACWSTGCPP